MNLIALLLAIFVALLLSNAMDTLPGGLWLWVHWPRWLLWLLLLSVFAWGMGDPKSD